MNSNKNIEQKLEQLADAVGTRDSFVNDVMGRIENSPVQPSKKTQRNHVLRRILMKNTIKYTAAAIILIAVTLSLTVWDAAVPNVMASELLTSAIEAVGNTYSIHIRAKLRTSPQDNFSHIDLEHDFVPVKLWAKQSEDGRVRMRVDKPRRQLTVDGKMATMIINHNYVVKMATSGYGVYNSDWLIKLIIVHELLENELKMAKDDSKHEISVYHEDIDGQELLVLQRYSQANVSKGDYLRNKFISDADRTFYYYFDPETKILVGMQMLVHTDEKEVVVFEITDIQYNPEIADSHFTLDIPEDAVYSVEPQILPDNEKYANMTPKEAAQAFFTACAEENWDEYLKFNNESRVSEGMKQYLGGIEIISIGEPFKSFGYRGRFVPYEIKLKNGQVKKHNLALKKNNPAKRWIVDGGI
ncbi:MAG: LolA family protein [Planctomycetota bacterium]|jgi:outer membrane lipoprotein-sorting protein